MNLFQNSPLGSTPSALLTWQKKKLLYNRLKNRIIRNKHEYSERLSAFITSSLAQSITSGSIPIYVSKKRPH